MSVLKDAINAMKEVVLLSDKVERAGKTLSELSKELREHDRRLLVIETTIDIARHQQKHTQEHRQQHRQQHSQDRIEKE